MKRFYITISLISIFLIFPSLLDASEKSSTNTKCIPIDPENALKLECLLSFDTSEDTLCNIRLSLSDDIKGKLQIDKLAIKMNGLKATAINEEREVELTPAVEMGGRSCVFVADCPLFINDNYRIHIPEGLLTIKPDMEEVDEIDIDEELLSTLSVAGAWHKAGKPWDGYPMFSIVDDDSLDGQIPSSSGPQYTYGYYSILYPLLESLGLRGNLSVEGRKIGITETPPYLNDNGKTVLSLQEEKGWDLLCHSMDCLGDGMSNWLVDSLNTPLAKDLLINGPYYGTSIKTVSVYDLSTKKQYWPNGDRSEWIETPTRYIKPYIADYELQREIIYNPEYDTDWHWGEWKRRAETFGIKPAGFVTHNSTSSHALVPRIREYFPNGLSDALININVPPMLSSGVRFGFDGQSMPGYSWDNKDNTFNDTHFKKYCSKIDETIKLGGWLIFYLHSYREIWQNSLPGSLVSEGGTYPDEWVIPMKGMDSANDPLSPPERLGIKNWSEWYPCPGTRLEMMWKVLKYAKEKGLRNVSCSEGFNIMGNKISVGYFNQGNKIGADLVGLLDSDDIYPHYVVSATGEQSYYNTLKSKEYTLNLNEITDSTHFVTTEDIGQFVFIDDAIFWNSSNPSKITLKVLDFSGKEVASSSSNKITFDPSMRGTYIICAIKSGYVIGSVKIAR